MKVIFFDSRHENIFTSRDESKNVKFNGKNAFVAMETTLQTVISVICIVTVRFELN